MVRTALFNWAYARHTGGTFVFRIEDTDAQRDTEESYAALLDALRWLGLDWDEGPEVGGPYGPYRQSERTQIYRDVVAALLDAGEAYYAFSTPEEVEARHVAAGRNPKLGYDNLDRQLTDAQRAAFVAQGRQPVVRLRMPDQDLSWDDLVRGTTTFAAGTVPDFALTRANGDPLYTLVNPCDDALMKITHVLRGEDLLSSTPRQLALYAALIRIGVAERIPQFAHLPTILGPDGEKLSKRHGAVSVMQYPADGYLPEALFNYLARLGWSHGDAEKFPREKFIEWFELDTVSRSAAQFDQAKLTWLNHEYIKEADPVRLAGLVEPLIVLRGAAVAGGPALDRVIALVKDRANTLHDIADAAMLFYSDLPPAADLITVHVTESIRPLLADLTRRLSGAVWEKAAIAAEIKATLATFGVKMPQLAMPVRVIVASTPQTPSLDAVLELFGRERVLSRLQQHV